MNKKNIMKNYASILMLSVLTVFIAACGNPEQTTGDSEEASKDQDVESMYESEEASHDHSEMEDQASSNAFIAAPENARVFFANLKDGDKVSSPVKIEMGVEGMTVHPAGEIIEGTGHHHIILSANHTPAGEAVPADETHIHYGGGQTETEIELEPGMHSISLQFADGLHRSYGEPMSTSIRIEVTK